MKSVISTAILFLILYLTVTMLTHSAFAAGNQSQGSFTGSNMTSETSSLQYILNNLKLTHEGDTKDTGMGLVIFIAASSVYIMVMQFAVGINGFNIFHMIVYFVLGGFIGGWFHSYEAGLVFSIILSLIFI